MVEYDNCRVLVTDQKIESVRDIVPILEQVRAPACLKGEKRELPGGRIEGKLASMSFIWVHHSLLLFYFNPNLNPNPCR